MGNILKRVHSNGQDSRNKNVPTNITSINMLRSLYSSCVSDVPNENVDTLGKITKVYDGDTCTCIFLHDNQVPMKINIRLCEIDAPEIKSDYELERTAALLVKNIVSNLILDKIVKIKISKWDKYGGRVIGDIYLPNSDMTISHYLLDKKLVKEYYGKKKELWTDSELNNIILFAENEINKF